MWTLLRNSLDWERYCQNMAQQTGATGTLVNWGQGPKEYPALVCSYQASPLKIVSAYVYETDARQLIQSLGTPLNADVPVAEPVVPAAESSNNPKQSEFNKWAAAHFLTLAHYMIETGICTRQGFEQKLTEALSLVDEVHAEKRDELLAEFTPIAKDILGWLDPPK